MNRVDLRDFRENASRYAREGEPIAVEEAGEVLGVFTPNGPDPRIKLEAAERLDRTMRDLLARYNLTEDEFMQLFEEAGRVESDPVTEAERSVAHVAGR